MGITGFILLKKEKRKGFIKATVLYMVIYYAFVYLSVDLWLTVSDNESKNNYKVILAKKSI